MFYKVDRASTYSDDQAPCEGAIRKKLPYYHQRTCESFEEFDSEFGEREGTWLSQGTEHSVKSWGISRREEDKEYWVVKISNLKQLQKFINDNGEIVMSSDSITIYDGYLE